MASATGAYEPDPIDDLRAKFLAELRNPRYICPACDGSKLPIQALCDDCAWLRQLEFQRFRYLRGEMAGDDYPEPLTDEEKARLSRHVLP